MTRLRLLVLGSAAGGGFPQWNCRCRVCSLYWQGSPHVAARTQSSLAVSADGKHWVLLNCSPDLRNQMLAHQHLHPRHGRRDTPVAAVFLTNGDVDHVAGLLSLRESQPFHIHATDAVLNVIAENRMFDVLNPSLVPRHRAELDRPQALPGGLVAEPFAVPGKVPLYQETDAVEIGQETDTTVGVKVSLGDDYFYYIPGCAEITPALGERLKGAPLVLFDGTLWRDDEMIVEGLGSKTGRRMGHISMSGPEGSIAQFEGLGVGRKVFVHINNTNPVLIEDSPERREAEAAGWEIAFDGMEISL
jgi:pyrroloquinoline quinone biosynthesis protein B